MLVLRNGQADNVLRVVEDMRREVHAEAVEWCEAHDVEPPGFVERPELNDVKVRFKGYGMEALAALDAVTKVHAEAKLDEGVDALKQRNAEVAAASRAFLVASVAEVTGLSELDSDGQSVGIRIGSANGTLTDEDVEVLDAARLVDELVQLAIRWGRLAADKKKVFGQPHQST